MEKIFISIPAYEDELLVDTIKDAIAKAKYPSRLIFGIALQYKQLTKPDLSFLNQNNLKLIEYDVDTRPGLIQIRKEISDLIEDEKYFFGIDAHTLFAQDWDQIYIDDHTALAKNGKACIASRISAEFLESGFMDTRWVLDVDTINVYNSNWDWPPFYSLAETEEYVVRHFVSANNWFTTTDFFKNNFFLNFNKSVFEEPQISLSLFLNGYKVYYPTKKSLVIANPKSETTNRDNHIHWKTSSHKNWNHDSINEMHEVFRFFYTGSCSLYSLDIPSKINQWWKAIGLEDQSKQVAALLSPQRSNRTYFKF